MLRNTVDSRMVLRGTQEPPSVDRAEGHFDIRQARYDPSSTNSIRPPMARSHRSPLQRILPSQAHSPFSFVQQTCCPRASSLHEKKLLTQTDFVSRAGTVGLKSLLAAHFAKSSLIGGGRGSAPYIPTPALSLSAGVSLLPTSSVPSPLDGPRTIRSFSEKSTTLTSPQKTKTLPGHSNPPRNSHPVELYDGLAQGHVFHDFDHGGHNAPHLAGRVRIHHMSRVPGSPAAPRLGQTGERHHVFELLFLEPVSSGIGNAPALFHHRR